MVDANTITGKNYLDAKQMIAPSERSSWPDFLRWTPSSQTKLLEVEQDLLRVVSSPYEQFFVDIGNNRHINTIKMGRGPPMVMLHGWAGGFGIFVTNFDAIAEHHTIYAIDWIGFGRSSRPPFKGKTPEEAEEYFLESFEAWRRTVGLERFALLGHSMGAYLSGLYALKNPDRISNLILADPWGVGPKPSNFEERLSPTLKIFAKTINSILISPLTLLRMLGPLGPHVMYRVRPDLGSKFAHLFAESKEGKSNTALDYIYHINAQRPSPGEEAFRALSDFGFARLPLAQRLHELDASVPVTFIYGEKTWMDIRAGYELKQKIKGPTRMAILPKSGHHVYVDNSELFNKYVIMSSQGTLPDISEAHVRKPY